MTVSELIKKLQTLDPELRVFTKGYEGGLEDVYTGRDIINVELNHNTEWYYGPHEEVFDLKIFPNAVKGVVI